MLEARNIHKSYNNNANKAISVLKGINLKITEGKFIVIMGPSGAGKSTLLHILAGLDTPTYGSVLFEGKDVNKFDDINLSKLRNTRIGFVFQFYHLLQEFSVLENVAMPALISPQSTDHRLQRTENIKEKASRILKEVGLGERLAHFPNQLSGGERQRAAIARALINKPAILFCDEPTGNLDSKTGSQIIELIKKINTENKMAVVLVTHNVELLNSADEVYHLRDGILVS